VKNKGTILIYNLIKIFPLFFTGCKLRPPCIGIEATVTRWHRLYNYYSFWRGIVQMVLSA